MNKEERLHRLLGDIDDDLVADAARKSIRKAVWVPAVAAAACVALTVGLWQGGVFDPAEIPVTPDEGTSVTEPAEPSKDTTTTTTTKPYILVGDEEDSNLIEDNRIPTLKDRLVSPALEAKMKEYRDVNAVFQVVVSLATTIEDWDECDTFIEANEEYQSLKKQYKEADKVEKRASDRLHESRVNNDDPQTQANLLKEYLKAEKIANDLSHKLHVLRQELIEKFMASLEEKRISGAAKYSKTDPIYGYGPYGTGYYMELTADAISELADKGGYEFYLASEKIDLSKPMDD